MIDPTLAFRTAVRAALMGAPAVTALVPADRIRAGSTRPGDAACIVLAGEQIVFKGRASGEQFCASVYLDAHIWAPEGADLAHQIGGAAMLALLDAPTSEEIHVDEWTKPSIRYLRDPAPERAWTHGVIELEAAIRWRAYA
ncbi:DUF3168 domain-containing protein [Roseivivax sp. THAF197b]|uniref:tail completion protein gp17 n=1 Tax=Roseivivax sp. THAF197b TaxID=2588299 RepID=UPI001267D390|nr:DUF3168 domain-containing protein [Roseivivax sp. THAF197b]QFS82344.1 hypothetical protein FIV09_05850 [Roseivivax sp. THAF197b]